MSIPPLDPRMTAAGIEQGATEKELQAALAVFSAECMRGDTVRLARATEAAHAALQTHLDAVAGVWALAKRAAGL